MLQDIKAALVSLTLSMSVSAYAAVTEYTVKSSWEAAVGPYITAPFTGFPQWTPITNQYAYLGIFFTDGIDEVNYVPDLFLNDGWGLHGAYDSITVEFISPQYSIAVEYPGVVQFQLYYRGQLRFTSIPFDHPGGGGGYFAGLISTQPFDKARIFDPQGGVFIDDLHFGPMPGLAFNFPGGMPDFIPSGGGTALRVQVTPLYQSPQPGTGLLHVDSGSGYVAYPMTEVSPNVYDAVFPASPCLQIVNYYFSAQTTTGQSVVWPAGAPQPPAPPAPPNHYSAISAASVTDLFSDNFQTHLGWTLQRSPNLTSGGWERVVPFPDCQRGNPTSDADGSGMCYLTQNSIVGTPAGCDTDVDGGSATLISPNMDASQGQLVLSYWQWYANVWTNSVQDDVFIVDYSIDGGATWINLETIGPYLNLAAPVPLESWVHKSFRLNELPEFVPTSQFRVRFIAQDWGTGSIVEAGIDGVRLQRAECGPCPADITGDGVVNVNDLLSVITGWGPCPAPPPTCPADISADGEVNINDLLAVINAWGPCP